MKGLLLVSFGTLHADTREKTYTRMEEEAREKFADAKIYRAWTSPTIRKKFKEQTGIEIFDVEGALAQMQADGIHEAVVISNYIIHGFESESLLYALEKYKGTFERLSCGKALLDGTFRIEQVAKYLKKELEVADFRRSEALIFMGHGSEHENNASYQHLTQCFRNMGYEHVFVACLEGEPTLEEVLPLLEEYKKVIVHPLTFVAGEHVKSDMIGEDANSWKNVLEAQGLEVEYIIKGLGEYPWVRDMFLEG